jgi:hypothetical protein
VLRADDAPNGVARAHAQGVRFSRDLETPAALPRFFCRSLPGGIRPPVERFSLKDERVPLGLGQLLGAWEVKIRAGVERDAPGLTLVRRSEIDARSDEGEPECLNLVNAARVKRPVFLEPFDLVVATALPGIDIARAPDTDDDRTRSAALASKLEGP